MNDLVARSRFPADADWAKERLADDALRIATLQSEIERNGVFGMRDTDRKRDLLKGRTAIEGGFVTVGAAAGFYPPFLRSMLPWRATSTSSSRSPHGS
jgi:hypothetical protein